MSTRVEYYIIYGIKFGEEFTEEYWEKDFRDETEYNPLRSSKPSFLTDGMNGDYTYFGLVKELYEDEETVIEFTVSDSIDIRNKFNKLYPEITIPEIKLYHVPHWT